MRLSFTMSGESSAVWTDSGHACGLLMRVSHAVVAARIEVGALHVTGPLVLASAECVKGEACSFAVPGIGLRAGDELVLQEACDAPRPIPGTTLADRSTRLICDPECRADFPAANLSQARPGRLTACWCRVTPGQEG